MPGSHSGSGSGSRSGSGNRPSGSGSRPSNSGSHSSGGQSGSHSSGSRTTRSGDDAVARPLHRVAFRGGSLAHWALFIPDVEGGSEGTLVHVGVETGSSGSKGNHRVRAKKIKISESTTQSAHIIEGTYVTTSMVKAAAEAAFSAGGYNAVTNNCQHFCYDVVAELNRQYPDYVPADAVRDVRRHGTVISNTTQFVRESRRR